MTDRTSCTYYVDFSDHTNMTQEEKTNLEYIQQNYRPLERVPLLTEYVQNGLITSDEHELLTGVPYTI